MTRTAAALAAIVVAAILTTPAGAWAQGRMPRRPPVGDGVSPGEIQRLFDAYVLMQAQQELQLNDEQYPRVLARLRTLQAARQRGQAERARLLQELRRLNDAAALDEAQVKTQLKALADAEARTATDVREALAGIDQVLDLRQQVRFRLFEEQMERRKVDLLMRARQANRQRNSQP
jgi:hypothetical protein